MADNFQNGGSHLERESSYQKYTNASGSVGYGPSAHDPNGSCYWADKDQMDPIWQHHDSNIAEHELGFDAKSMNGESFVRVDCDDLSAHNQRVASGREPGANDNFTGVVRDSDGDPVKGADGKSVIDPSVYNQRTSGGQPECVTDQMPQSVCHCSSPQRFDDPNELSTSLCNKGDAIATLPEGDARDAKLSQWNAEADALQTRMAGEQDYLQSRIADHEKRMSEFPEGSLEHTRAMENRDWCQNYSNELAASQSKLQEKQDALNNTEHTTKTADQGKADEIPATSAAKSTGGEDASAGIPSTAAGSVDTSVSNGASAGLGSENVSPAPSTAGGIPTTSAGGVDSGVSEGASAGMVNTNVAPKTVDEGISSTASGYTPPAAQEAPQITGPDKGGPSM